MRGSRLLLSVWLLAGVVGCSVPIAANLQEADANRVVVALEENGIASRKQADASNEARWQVTVARGDASAAARVLRNEELPPPESLGVIEAIGKGSIIPSRSSEHAKLVAGTAGELERSLRGIDGILAARVHLAVPTADPLAMQKPEQAPTASVLLRHRGSTCPLGSEDVKRLVAGAVPGLTADRVSVVTAQAAAANRKPELELAHFGPLTVARSSMLALRLFVSAAVLINLLLIGVVLGLWLRIRRPPTKNRSAEAD